MKLKKRRREEERSITSFMNEMKKNDYFYDDVNDTKNKSDIAKIVSKWCLDDNNKNILYKKNNVERYPDFKLYKMISRTVHNLEPHMLLTEPIFKKFSVFETQIKKAKLMNIDEIPVMYD